MNILSYADSETDNWQQVVLAQDTTDLFIVNHFDGKSARKSYYANKD